MGDAPCASLDCEIGVIHQKSTVSTEAVFDSACRSAHAIDLVHPHHTYCASYYYHTNGRRLG